ncbi:MAG: hypothetical protein QG622_1161 [Actinomycetota bacterium]|nr:hypothetical protein [Actinomycetota bacterium]
MKHLVARVITEVGTPAVILVGVLLAIGAHSDRSLASGLGWGLLAAVFGAVVPYGVILFGVHRGTLGDHHIVDRAQRIRPLLQGLVSVAVGIGVLVAVGAPREVLAATGAILSAGAVTTWVVAVAVGWSRVELREHTVWQVIAGSVMGPVVTGSVFVLCR